MVVETDLLLWTHPLGSVLIDVDEKLARSVHLDSDDGLYSLVSVVDSYRYIYQVSWYPDSSSDQLWLKSYDMTRLTRSTDDAVLVLNQSFDLGDTVDGSIVVDSDNSEVAFCYLDSSSGLNFAYLDIDDSESLYTVVMNDAN